MTFLEILNAVNTVFASIFYLIGVIVMIVIAVAVVKVKNKVTQTTDMAQDAIFSVHEMIRDLIQTTLTSTIIKKITSIFTGR